MSLVKRGLGSSETVAILAHRPEDAARIVAALDEAGLNSTQARDVAELHAMLGRCGLAVVMQEALDGADLRALTAEIAAQPDWSGYPFILLTPEMSATARNPRAESLMADLANVVVVEFPFHPMTFVSFAHAALANRRRQYQLRDRMEALETSRASLARQDERLKFAIAAAKLGFWELTFPERDLAATRLCKINLGLPPDAPLTYEGLLALVAPEDRERLLDSAQTAIDTHTDYDVECRIGPEQDGPPRWAEIRGRATYDGDRPTGMVGLCLDVTDRKASEERQELLIRELHHRVKNTLSTVQAIVGATARGATSIDQFYRDFTGRIISLANTHTILTEELWQRASLHELLAKELDLYDSGQTRVRVNGPPLELPSNYAVPLGMAFHELTTNAAKYGALANGQGYVSIDWSIDPEQSPPLIRIAWAEHDGPAVSPPTRQGFGTRLLQRVLTAQMRADVGIAYDPTGLRVSVAFQMPDMPVGSPPKGWS